MRGVTLEDRCATRTAILAGGVVDATEAAELRGDDGEVSDAAVRTGEGASSPREGAMRGLLIVPRKKKAGFMKKALGGGKATKEKTFSLDGGGALTCIDDDDYEPIPMDEVLAVRPATTSPELLKAAPNGFELVFAPPRPAAAFGVADAADLDAWVVACKVARRGAGGARARPRTPSTVEDGAAILKQRAVLRAVADADRELTAQSELGNADGSDVGALAELVSFAAAKAGAPEICARILQELLYWPVEAALGAAGAWKTALEALRLTREKRGCNQTARCLQGAVSFVRSVGRACP